MKQIEDLAKAALGFDASRGDQISVQNIAFQIPPAEKLDAPTFTDRVRVVSERWTGLLRYVVLIGAVPDGLLAGSQSGQEAGAGGF